MMMCPGLPGSLKSPLSHLHIVSQCCNLARRRIASVRLRSLVGYMRFVRCMAELKIVKYWHRHNAGLRTRRQSVKMFWKECTDRDDGHGAVRAHICIFNSSASFRFPNNFSTSQPQAVACTLTPGVNCTWRLFMSTMPMVCIL